MDFRRLSVNLIAIIEETLKNQELVNLIGFDGNNPSNNNVNPKEIAPKAKNERILPYPFDVDYKEDVRTQLHIYYPRISFESNGNASKVVVLFDIVVHKDIWLLMDNGEKVIRPYQISKALIDTFNKKRVKGVGELHFLDANHTPINEEFEGFRLVAQFTEF